MSTEEKKPEETKTEGAKPADAPKKSGGGALGNILKIVIPAILAAGASYGGTRYAKAQNAIVIVKEKEEAEHGKKHHEDPPGPTLTLEPFLLSVIDSQHKSHPMKMSVAVEFKAAGGGGEHGGGGAEPKTFMPRIRDAVLTYLRGMSYEEISEPTHLQKIRVELLAHCKEAGVEQAEKILITDFVIQ